MAKFITFFSYTESAMKAIVDRPSDREAAARALVESVGGSLDSFYWMQGKHDGFLIFTVADGATAAALVVGAASSGAIVNLETHQVFDRAEQSSIVSQAATAVGAYRPPTA